MVTLAGGWGNLLGELLAHGDDIAAATGKAVRASHRQISRSSRATRRRCSPAGCRPSAADVDESWDLEYPFGLIRFTIADGVVPPRDRRRAASGPPHDRDRRRRRMAADVPVSSSDASDEVAAHLVDQFVTL